MASNPQRAAGKQEPSVKRITLWATVTTTMVFAAKFIPDYLSLKGLHQTESWKDIAEDIIWTIPVGLIVIIFGLFKARNSVKAKKGVGSEWRLDKT